MLQGTCHCGLVRWQFEGAPESVTACNCTACRRYGALWAYGYEGEGVSLIGHTEAYVRKPAAGFEGPSLGFHFCPACGSMMAWRGLRPNAEGRRRVGVNLRMTEPGPIAGLPIDHFDGLDKWEDLPRDGRCVRDMWS